MQKEKRCYLCGRASEEVQKHVAASITEQFDEVIEEKQESVRRAEKENHAAQQKLNTIVESIAKLPVSIQKLKITTLLADRHVFQAENPVLTNLLDELRSPLVKKQCVTESMTLTEASEALSTIEPAMTDTTQVEGHLRFLEHQKSFVLDALRNSSREWFRPRSAVTLNFGGDTGLTRTWDTTAKAIWGFMDQFNLDFDQALQLAQVVLLVKLKFSQPRHMTKDQAWQKAIENTDVPSEFRDLINDAVALQRKENYVLPQWLSGTTPENVRRRVFSLGDTRLGVELCVLCDGLTAEPPVVN